jgi:hypothetical protein
MIDDQSLSYIQFPNGILELDEIVLKYDSGIDGTDSGCGTGSVMFNIAE